MNKENALKKFWEGLPKWLKSAIQLLGVALIVLLIGRLVYWVLGLDVLPFCLTRFQRLDITIKVTGFALAAWGLQLSAKRLNELYKQGERADAKATDDRFSNAVGWLGNENDAAQIGAIKVLNQLVKNKEDEEKYLKDVFEVLLEYVRAVGLSKDKSESKNRKQQIVLHYLFFKTDDPDAKSMYERLCEREGKEEEGYGYRADLNEAQLDGLDWEQLYLKDIGLIGANLKKAQFTGANLTDARLQDADLEKATFYRARIEGARFDIQTLCNSSIKKNLLDALWGSRGILVYKRLPDAPLRKEYVALGMLTMDEYDNTPSDKLCDYIKARPKKPKTP